MSESLSLTVEEASTRAALLDVQRYDLAFDLTGLLHGDELRTVSSITFSCTDEGAETFLECLGEVEEATLNGQPLPTGYPTDGRLTLSGLARDNVVVVRSVQRDTSSGRGVQRAVDPVDKAVYIWTTFEPDDARVAYACFDQPDLKAVFGIEVTAPPEWTVVSNSGAAEVTEVDGNSHWQFADTPLLSTYLPVVNAGPFHQVRSERGGYDLGLYARASLAPMLDRDAEELFDLTATGLKFYGEQFQLPFPQTRYDQIFVPEYGGAMENYGCVTWSDAFVYRDEPSYAERELRAVVLLHEMAHMWFGDMVTMRWWDDLWLNESFADWACAWCATAVTEFGDVWAGNLASDKLRAYAADAAPTTHPIRQPIPDTEAASASFDAITYPKGAAVLKQLVAYVGEDNFVAALAAYFRRYAWQNTTLQDLIHELELTSGLDLSAWVTGWLESSGTDRLTLRRDGRALALTATSPSHRPPLPHQLEVGVYSGGGDTLVRQQTIGVRVGGEVTELPEVDEDALLVVNDNDLTFASVRPDDASLQLLLEHGGRLPTALARTLAVTTSHDLLFNGELSADAFVTCVLNVLPNETADSVIEPLLSLAVNVADYWSPAARRPALLSRLADLSISLADSPARRLAAVRALARTASTPEQLSELATRADAPDLGWRRLTRLAELGQLDEAEVAEHLAADPNPEAWVSAEVCRSAQADPAAKQRAWDVTVVERKLPVDRVSRLGLAFWRRGQDEVLAPFRQAYLDVLPELGHSGMTWTLALTGSIFPQADTDDDFPARLVSAATAPGVSYLVGKRVLERTDTLRRMLVTRSLA